jgi:phage-related protein
MTQPLEVAYVELRPIGEKDFQKRIDKIMDKVTKSMDQDMAKAASNIEESFDDMADDVFKSFDRVNHSLNAVNEVIDRELNVSLRETREELREIDREGSRSFSKLRNVAAKVGEVFGDVKDAVGGLFDRLLSSGGSGFDNLSSGLAGAGTGLMSFLSSIANPASLISFGVTLAAVVALVPLVLALAAALSQLAGAMLLLPGAAGVAVAAFAPLIVAFQGFGEAISAIMEKDPEKINEALKSLSPSARSVAKEFQKLFPQLERLQDLTQEALFKPLVGVLTTVGSKLLPEITKGFTSVAGAFGKFFADLGTAMDGDIVEAIGDSFESTVTILNNLSPSIINLIGTLFGVMEHGLPFIERMSVAIGKVIDGFAEWLSDSMKTGDFDTFLESAFRTMGLLVDIGQELGRVILAIFGEGADEGEDFLTRVADATAQLADFLESAQGKESLDRLFDIVSLLGDAFQIFIQWLVGAGIILDQVGDFFADLGDVISDIPDDLEKTWKSITNWFDGVVDTVETKGQEALDWFAGLGDKIIGFITSIPDRIREVFTRAFDGIFITVGMLIASVVYFFTRLPQDIANAIVAMPEKIGKFFGDLWTNVEETSATKFDEFMAWVSAIPTKIQTALESLGTIVGDIFWTAGEKAQAFFVSSFDAIVSFVGGVPARIGAAFRSAGSFVADVAGDIVSAIRSVMNRAIDRINDGISRIDDIMPGSLGRIPRLATGAIARQPSITGEAGAEANIPLTDPRAMSMLRDALGIDGEGSGTVVNITPGAVVVSYHGVVPTEAEAMRTGNAIVTGMEDSFSRRNTRAQVRTI